MTERLYLKNAYRFEFDAEIIEIRNDQTGVCAVLDKTCFYPEAGGQNYDTGELDGIRVISVVEDAADDNILLHYLEKPGLNKGDSVRGVIDSLRRLENMRKHTGQHILSRALVSAAKTDTVSAHLGESESTIELDREDISDEQLAEAEMLANRIVLENRAVSSRMVPQEELKTLDLRKIPDREGTFRIVEIDGFDVNACGGTHLHSTGEVGPIKIIAKEKMRGHLRITFICGLTALEDYRAKHTILTDLANEMTCHFSDIPDTLKKLNDQNSEYRREITRLNKKLMPYEITEMVSSADETNGVRIITGSFPDRDIKDIKYLASNITSDYQAVTLFETGETFLLSVSEKIEINAGSVVKELIEKFGGRGGGGRTFAQIGSIPEESRNKLIDSARESIIARLGEE